MVNYFSLLVEPFLVVGDTLGAKSFDLLGFVLDRAFVILLYIFGSVRLVGRFESSSHYQSTADTGGLHRYRTCDKGQDESFRFYQHQTLSLFVRFSYELVEFEIVLLFTFTKTMYVCAQD